VRFPLSGGACACCGAPTAAAVLWAGREGFVRVPCCDACVSHLGELERGQLTEAAAELEQLERPQTTQAVSRPSA
jgi:hypothetical protein